MATVKMQSVSVHVGEYSECPTMMPGVHKVIFGVDQDGTVWEHTKAGWKSLSMDVAEA